MRLADPLVGPLSLIPHAGVDGDDAVPSSLKLGERIRDNFVGGFRDRGVLKDELRVGRLDGELIVERLLGCDGSSERVSRVFVPYEDLLVSSVVESGEKKIVVVAVRRPEVKRLHSEDLDESILDLPELIVHLIPRESRHVWVAPRMRSERVLRVVESFDIIGMVVNAVVVVSIQEEGSLSSCVSEALRDRLLVDVWTIVQSNGRRSTDSTILHDLNSSLLNGLRSGGNEGGEGCDGED